LGGEIKIADVGTGSGAIAVTLAVRLPAARIVATDISEAALVIARGNAERHAVADRIHFVCADLLDGVEGTFDAIVANLPYVASDEWAGLPVSRWEPRLALDGGPDGLEPIRRLLRQAPEKLVDGGALFLEIGHDQGAPVAALCADAFPGAAVRVRPDLAGRDRVVVVDTT